MTGESPRLPWECIILDVDGTLIDSNDAHAHAWVDALAAFDIHVAFEKVRPLIGMGGDKLLPKVAGLRDDEPGGKDVSERRSEIFRERYLPTLRPFPMARELLARMHGRGLRLIVASSAKEDELGALLDVAGVRGLIERKTSSSDAENSKPDPDIVVAALKRAKVEPARAIMIGDTPYDLASAAQAGVGLVAFRCGGGWTDADFSGARAIYDGPVDLFERFDASPIALG
jgi:HAD superfamily hydrolase (TIGR01509 family)